MPGSKAISILIADDDVDDCLNTRQAFERNRLANAIHFVADGAELLDYVFRRGVHVDAQRPGLILLDLNMPKVDGYDALRAIKADAELRLIPVVVFSTSSQEEDIARCYALGASSFITKPVTFDALVRLIGGIGSYWFQLVELPTPSVP
jgi:CheY-like chemotaxis protein